jgi:hypothetical protein
MQDCQAPAHDDDSESGRARHRAVDRVARALAHNMLVRSQLLVFVDK